MNKVVSRWSCSIFNNLKIWRSRVMAEAPPTKKRKEEKDDSDEAEGTDDPIPSSVEPSTTAKKRLPRKKCILLLSYCGKGYLGMQRNPGVPTIEEDLVQALWKANVISEEHKDNLGKLGFQRCARTDKGVSAARQVVSLKMVPDPLVIPTINQYLPNQIRVIALKKVVKSFNSKQACTSRVYEYLLPTYVFAPFESTNLRYRINASLLSRVQELLKKYEGTHNFHNFTSGKKHDDPSANRFIMSFIVGHPFVRGDVEFLSLSVEGQSFMLHQIRKMIGLVIAIVRGYLIDDVIYEAFKPEKVDIPRAPALGLLLDEVKYNHYNRKFGDDGVHERLDWLEFEDAVTSFKEQYIYKHIIDTEIREYSMLRWLETLQLHNFHQSVERLGKNNEESPTEASKTQTETTKTETIDNQAETDTTSIQTEVSETQTEAAKTETIDNQAETETDTTKIQTEVSKTQTEAIESQSEVMEMQTEQKSPTSRS